VSEVLIVPTGTANLASVIGGFDRLGVATRVSSEPSEIAGAGHVVLPGVGSFASGMRALRETGVDGALAERFTRGRATLAICLGLQLLLEGSDENPDVRGLGLVPGRARRLPSTQRVPQMGWNHVQADSECRWLRSGEVYFANSFALDTPPPGFATASFEYGGRFVAAFERYRWLACQFHPELSGELGQSLLEGWYRGVSTSRSLVRVIPCLDVRDGRVVKGVKFQGLRDAGDPAELAHYYDAQGADELVVLDVSATPEGRRTAADTVRRVRRVLSIPLTVGGGIRGLEDARRLLEAGADKVAVNTAAVERPELLGEIAADFGCQCTVLSLDAERAGDGWRVRVRSGTTPVELDAIEWARRAVAAGAGEILLTSFDRDGTKQGYDLELLRAVADAVDVPIIASGGAADASHFVEAAQSGATGVLAASIFHYSEHTIADSKHYLRSHAVGVRT